MLPTNWKKNLEQFINIKVIEELDLYIKKLRKNGEIIFPEHNLMYKAFELCDHKNTKVVIIGQDPYHTPKHANGLAFSSQSKNLPPSLKNIIKELNIDIPDVKINHGNLENWAKQGILLLNSSLSVVSGAPNSHKDLGWDELLVAVLKSLNKYEKVVYVLWGNYAQSYQKFINNKSLIIKSSHPSPLSAHVSFFGSKPFSQINKYLKNHDIEEIDWNLL